MTTGVELGVNQIASQVRLRLRRYLEAQYHIRHPGIIEERRLLLEEPGGISQRPFIEVTPSYAVAGAFSSLQIPKAVSNLLEEMASWSPGVGVFPPYRHQADALEKFFSKGAVGNDLIVATGTGSGKTETFLYAILGALAIEGTERPESFARPGIRALLLYPMNALVSDQTARLRRLLGNERLAGLLRERWGRNPRFGMYTSRTPYPGVRDGAKDKRHLDSLLGYYENLQASTLAEDVELVHELKRRGRWPAKDLVGFYARNEEEQVTVKTGKRAGTQRTLHHWDQRFRTQAADRELLTRHEIQAAPPDLLITNYSMLEYMLLRPIERPIFEATRAWLASDPRNKFTLVLDEAHMYRGVGGAEVGLLIRRLMSRLGISRDRLQCILTSASLGGGSESDEAGRRFGSDLTGETDHRQFVVVRGEREARSGARPGTTEEASVLARVNPGVLAAAEFAKADVNETLAGLSEALGWAVAPDVALQDGRASRQHIGQRLTGFGPLELLLELAAGNAIDFEELAGKLFPKSKAAEAQRATDGLLALGTYSRRDEPGREEQPLLPTRVHLLFRGLPSQYVCINGKCNERRDTRGESLLGRIYTEPRTLCGCGGRVFELLTHRDCGAAYLRVFATSATPEFLWHERGGLLTEFGGPLHELHIFLEEPHPSQQGSVHPMFVDIFTGRVLPGEEQHSERLKLCYRALTPAEEIPNTSTFGTCPACTQRTQSGGSLKIMDLATKGEQPFANLVREQFVCQLATKEASDRHPNEGKKALLFSDGRQKAARLARDLPREVERDSFREALVLACQELSTLPAPQLPLLDETIFAAFVSVCARHHLHFFDGHDQRELLEECSRFRKDYGDLDTALASRWRPTPPTRFRTALARQIGDPYYSLVAACAAVVQVAPAKLRILQKRLAGLTAEQNIAEIAAAWLREMLKRYAFDPAISKDARIDEFDYFQPIRAADGLKQFFDKMANRTGLAPAQIGQVRRELFDVLTRDAPGGDDSGRLVVGDAAVLHLAIDESWLQCAVCGNLQIAPQFGVCAVCQDARLEPRPPDHEYMRSRKGFFREPLRAVLNGARPIHITAEEHTAQLSQRDAGVVYATTEEYELRFQDIALGPDKPPVDILSCTTTMEVGIDIGSLTAVGLRTVPPQRENYQQRAGRAGRRGTSVSSVLMFAQGGAHDAHYFANPAAIISGPPREPRLKADNPRLARRHVNAHLLQTFFHARLDALSEEARRDLVAERPGLLSVLGRATVFFEDTGDMSFTDFESWMRERVLTPNSAVINEIASWLPNAIFPKPTEAIKRSFVREIAERLLMSFLTLRDEYVRERASQGNAEATTATDEDSGGLLDVCFDRGLLPSYAFPTDLCSFVIQEWDKSGAAWRVGVAERPQLGKAQALSEYAPGRLLVVNKLTYRVGGIFVDGPPTASPAKPLFAQALSRYVGCPRCSFVTIEGGGMAGRTSEGAPCPVCRTPLFVREYLDPPSFTPEDGRALREGDRDQDVTFASSAQLPEITGRDEFNWKSGPGEYLRHAYGEDVLLVVANKGKESAGFSVCESCGAAWIDGEEPDGAHKRPFLIPRHILERETAGQRCNGEVRRGLFLVHDFRTDLLLLRGAFRRPLGFQPEQPWLYDALATLAEALSLGASLHLDIDPGELSAGFRLLPPLGADDAGVAEVYLFDTASGGAGYAAEAGEQLEDVLARTEMLLLSCPGHCERSCTRCLRHYGNRFLHSRLDRRLALSLLRYFWKGIVPGFPSAAAQKDNLAALARFFELEGWSVSFERDGALRCEQSRSLLIGTFPALLDATEVERDHPLKKRAGAEASLLPDYLIEHDLPSAYRRVVSLTGRATGPGSIREANTSTDGRIVKVKVRDLRRPSEPPVSGTVLLGADVKIDDESFAVRIPNPGLNKAGFRAGRWLVVRAFTAADLGLEKWLIVLRSRGKFGATGAEWTIAHVRELPGDEESGSRVQLSYGSATGKEYRPERLSRAEVQIVAAVVCHADEAT